MTAHAVRERGITSPRAEEQMVTLLKNGTFDDYVRNRDYIRSIAARGNLAKEYPILEIFELMHQSDLADRDRFETLNPAQRALAEERLGL